MSSTVPRRPSGVASIMACSSSGICSTMSSAEVAIEPGEMELTRILGARSWAMCRVSLMSAPLAVP